MSFYCEEMAFAETSLWLLITSQKIGQLLHRLLNCLDRCEAIDCVANRSLPLSHCRRLHSGDQTERDIRGSAPKL